LRIVLKEHPLYSKIRKFSFYQKKIHYLGHIISEKDITVDLENIKAIREWLIPRNAMEFRSFMGLEIYYRRFIGGFSKIAHPITYLQKKGIKFEQTSKCEENFHLLKELLKSSPNLNIVDSNENFVVYTDACREGLDGILTQNGHVVCYDSRKLKEHGRNYATHDL